jgi:hypothetical protein
MALCLCGSGLVSFWEYDDAGAPVARCCPQCRDGKLREVRERRFEEQMRTMDYRFAMDILRDAEVHGAAIVRFGDGFHIFSRTELLASGQTISDAMRAGGYIPPPPRRLPLFMAKGCNVIRGDERICQCRSANMAKRVANALNDYAPGDRRY